MKRLIQQLYEASKYQRKRNTIYFFPLKQEWSLEQYLRLVFITSSFFIGFLQLYQIFKFLNFSHTTYGLYSPVSVRGTDRQQHPDIKKGLQRTNRKTSYEQDIQDKSKANQDWSASNPRLHAEADVLHDTRVRTGQHSEDTINNGTSSQSRWKSMEDDNREPSTSSLLASNAKVSQKADGRTSNEGEALSKDTSTIEKPPMGEAQSQPVSQSSLQQKRTSLKKYKGKSLSEKLQEVYPFPRYAIVSSGKVENTQGHPDCRYYLSVKPLQFYSYIFPFWMIAELLIKLNSRKKSNYPIRRINCWKNPRRLNDVVGFAQIKDSVYQIIHSLSNRKRLANIQNWLGFRSFRTYTSGIAKKKGDSVATGTSTADIRNRGLDQHPPQYWYDGGGGRYAIQNYLFVGPSGTGKTLLAQAIAGSSKVSMFCTTLSELQSSSLTTGPAHLRTLFQLAKVHSPCIIVLENLELIGRIRKYTTTHLDLQLFTELLVALTPPYHQTRKDSSNGVVVPFRRIAESLQIGFANILQFLKNSEPIMKNAISVYPNILIGTTDNLEKLDPAFIRPGRFDRIIQFSSPTKKDRIRLLEHYKKFPIRNRMKSTHNHRGELEYFARRTYYQGFTQADLYMLMNESSLQSLKNWFFQQFSFSRTPGYSGTGPVAELKLTVKGDNYNTDPKSLIKMKGFILILPLIYTIATCLRPILLLQRNWGSGSDEVSSTDQIGDEIHHDFSTLKKGYKHVINLKRLG